MAILRGLFLRRTTLSLLLRHRTLSSAAEIPPPPPPWKRKSVRHKSSSSRSKRGHSDSMYEDFSFNQIDVLEGYKFAYEEFKPRELDITEIEGCDLKHWLVTIDFPQDPKPCPEDMVRFYEKTVSKTLNISLEEAKKKIYACSTSNYTGFHVEVSEEESEKFRDKPGVVFILPDSYVDKEKKEYGGDKYINGVIIPRPRPTLEGKAREEPRKDKRAEPLPARPRIPRPNQQERISNSQELSMREIPHLYSQQGPTNRAKRSYDAPQSRNHDTPGYNPVPQSHVPPMAVPGFVPYHDNYQEIGVGGYPGHEVPEIYWQEQNPGAVGQGYDGPMLVPPPEYVVPYDQGPDDWQGQDYPGSQGYPYPGRPVQDQGYGTPNDYPNPYGEEPNGGYQEDRGPPMGYWRGPDF